jgi:glycosyltransferase involved in cell wall biosynthesis
MKILLIADPGIPVPPSGYGGIERIVGLLANEYKRQGHHVEILASKSSFIDGIKIHSIGADGFPPTKKELNFSVLRAWKFLILNFHRFDCIHNFGRLLYFFPILPLRINKIMSYQREISFFNIKIISKLYNRNLFFTGCSQNLINRFSYPGKWFTIYNTVDFNQYHLNEQLEEESYLIFLGRIERIKGCHTAIKVAIETNQKLIIAGNISNLAEELEYFNNEIKPFIDGIQIKYVGELNDLQKNKYLRQAKALLMPIEWDEPFGIVMIEAMACGTPVIGFRKGSVSEVIDEGITGFSVTSYQQMLNYVSAIYQIDRSKCRDMAKNKFNVSIIASKYLEILNS